MLKVTVMTCQEVDNKLLALLNDLPYFSRLGTCLTIRLADHAAQLCGCRSTRQVDEWQSEEVQEQYDILLSNLLVQIQEGIDYLSEKHSYKRRFYFMSDNDLELLLENTLYYMAIYNNHHIFFENFFHTYK